jgi:hypothetical protein
VSDFNVEEKKEHWGAVLGGCFLWVMIVGAFVYGVVMVALWFKSNRDIENEKTQKALTVKEAMAPVSKADVFSIDSPFFNSPVIVYRAKIGDNYYVIVQGKNGSVSICPEPTTKKVIGRGVDEMF